jgi:hypothetical protein
MLTSIAYLMILQTKAPPKLAPAVFADASARRIVNFSRTAYSKLKSARIVISSDNETKKYAFSGGRVYGFQKGAEWAWSQKRFTLLCNRGLFRGTMGVYNVNAWLAKIGASPEIVPIQLASAKNPIDTLVGPGSRVRRAGTMALDGVAVDIVEIKSARLKVTMAVRQDNRLIADLEAVNVDKDGKVLFKSSRRFSWSNVNKSIPTSVFAVGAGKSPRPIKNLN